MNTAKWKYLYKSPAKLIPGISLLLLGTAPIHAQVFKPVITDVLVHYHAYKKEKASTIPGSFPLSSQPIWLYMTYQKENTGSTFTSLNYQRPNNQLMSWT